MYRSTPRAVTSTWMKLINSANQQLYPDQKPVQTQVNLREGSADPVRNQGAEAGVTAAVPKYQRECKEKSEKSFLDRPNLQEAILWSEILGKPVCRRRKRRSYGD